MKFSKYTETALKAAKAGADILMKYYAKDILNIEYKGKIDPVSQADRNSQKKIISIIKSVFPEHGVLAEEDGVNEIRKDYCWIIDPLDGTVNFVHGLPMFCVSIALKYKNEIISGVLYSPVMKEVFIAQKGKGAYLNGKRIKVSKAKDLIRCLAVTGFPYELEGKKERVFKNFETLVAQSQGIRRYGSAALDMAYVACGRMDYYWEENIKPWDIAAGLLIVKEAGGVVSDYYNKNNYFENYTMIAANNKTIHQKVFKILNAKR